jgi:DNA invertase Pin-like site-specific DNA recombinase
MLATTPAVTAAPNPQQLRAVRDLLRAGWRAADIMRALGISRATYYRRAGELSRLESLAAGRFRGN